MVFVFNGGFPFSKEFRTEDDVDIKPYTTNRDKLKHGRKLLLLSRGADAVVETNVNEVIGMIRDVTTAGSRRSGRSASWGGATAVPWRWLWLPNSIRSGWRS